MKLFRIKVSLALLALTAALGSRAQGLLQGHSHNDYEQSRPFWLAWEQGFGSVEADVYRVGDELLVAHNRPDARPDRTLRSLYLDPLVAALRADRRRRPFSPPRRLQLLVDLKDSSAMSLLVKQWQPYSKALRTVRLVVSGERPPAARWPAYPGFVFFDGRPGETYSPETWAKVGLVSESILQMGQKPAQLSGPYTPPVIAAIRAFVQQAHAHGRPARLWGMPDTPPSFTWQRDWGLDYIGTDHPALLSQYLRERQGNK